MPTVGTASTVLVFILVAHAVPVGADNGDEFANNLFSDLAPLLALFGERVTMQFMSQSMGWADNIILAMGPLGIITAIVGAIRVGGPTWLKALIGRARENLAVAEAELMSSTSHEVCELWNGREVVRCMGSAPISEFIVLLPPTGQYKGAKITAKKASEAKGEGKELEKFDLNFLRDFCLWRQRMMHTQNPRDSQEKDAGGLKGHSKPEVVVIGCGLGEVGQAPNVSLNSHNDFWRGELRVIAVFGIILQLGVVAYSGFATYYPIWRFEKNGNRVARYAYPCTAVGTLLLVAGMLVCGHVVESSTKEERYQVKEGRKARLVWLQQPKTVNDQVFDSFAVFSEHDRTIIIKSCRSDKRYDSESSQTASEGGSRTPKILAGKKNNVFVNAEGISLQTERDQDNISLNTTKQRKETRQKGRPISLEYKTVVGVMVSLCGFVVQFIGLRGMHWSASIAQLGAVFVMAILRSYVRRGLARPPQSQRLSSKFELDWFATTLGDLSNAPWVAASHEKEKASVKKRPTKLWRIISPRTHEEQDQNKNSRSSEANGKGSPSAYDIMIARRDLGRLAHWRGPASEDAIALTKAIELTMDALFVTPEIEFVWSLRVSWIEPETGSDLQSNIQLILFKLEKIESKWKANLGDIEAALSLWLYAVNKFEQKEHHKPETQATRGHGNHPVDLDAWQLTKSSLARRSLRLLGSNSRPLRHNLEWWIPPHTEKRVEFKEVKEDSEGTLEVENHRIVGCDPRPDQQSKNLGDHTQFSCVDMHTGMEEATNALLATESNNRLSIIYAQDMFSAFMWSLAEALPCSIKGGADVVRSSEDTGRDDAWQSFKLQNDHLSKLAQDIQRTGLGTLDQIYFSIIPPLSGKEKLPQADGIVTLARQNAKKHERRQHWKEEGLVYLWLFQTAKILPKKSSVATKATALLVEYLRAVTAALKLREAPYAEMPIPELGDLKLRVEKSLEDADKRDLSSLIRLYKEQGRSWKYVSPQEARCDYAQDKNYPDAFQFKKLHRLQDSYESQVDREIKRALDGGEDVNQKDIHDWTPLHYAAAKGFNMVVMRLLHNRADINAGDLVEWTPLHYACKRGNANIAQILVQKGAELNARGRAGITPLHCAAMKGHADVVRVMIEAGAVLDVLDASGKTPLMWAIYGGHDDVVKGPLRDSNRKLRDHNGRTALHLGALAGHEAVVKILLGAGAEKEARDRDGGTPLHWAARNGHEAVVKVLLGADAEKDAKDGDGGTPLHLAAENGREVVVKVLLDAGAEKDAKDGFDATPLHLAARNGHETVVKILLGADAEKDAKDGDGVTPLHRAAESGREAAVKVLLGAGAEKDAKDGFDATPLYRAAENGREAAVEVLLGAGAEKDAKDRIDATPLHWAARNGHEAVVKALLGAGAEKDAKDRGSETPLHRAAESGHEAVVKVLLGAGAEKNARDGDGSTPLHWAAKNGRAAVVKALLGAGAEKDTKDGSGATPLHWAARNGYEAVVKILEY